MKKFKNLNTGLIEIVTNKELIAQYEKYTDKYEEIKTTDKKADKKADKKVEEEKPVEETDAE